MGLVALGEFVAGEVGFPGIFEAYIEGFGIDYF